MENVNWFQKTFTAGARPYLWLAALIFLLYAQSLSFGFTYLDDNELIIKNFPILKSFNLERAFGDNVFFSDKNSYYRPLLSISFMIDALFSGSGPYPGIFHFGNIVLHILASFALLVFLKKLGARPLPAFLATVILAIHPVLTQAVAWIPGRNDSLLALFSLLSLIFLIDYDADKKKKNLYLHLLFFTAALFTKETAIVLPIICLLYLALIAKNRLISKDNFFLALSWLVPILIFFIGRIMIVGSSSGLILGETFKTLYYNAPVIPQLLGKIFFPFNLSVLPLVRDTSPVFGIGAMIFLAVLLIFFKKNSRGLLVFGLLWFLLFILPTIFLHNPAVPFGTDYQLEHRLYLPIIGILLVFLSFSFTNKIEPSNKKTLLAVLCLLIIFCALTFLHSRNFKNQISFWGNAAKTAPSSPLAHRNFGVMYFINNDLVGAEREIKKSLKINPDEIMAHNNLGAVYAKQGFPEKAAEEYKKEIKINPTNPDAYYNLGIIRYKAGAKKEAAFWWERSVDLDPENLDAYYNLTLYYMGTGDEAKLNFYIGKMEERGIDFQKKAEQIQKTKTN